MMAKKLLLIFLIGLGLFLVQQFFIGLKLPLHIFLVAVIYLTIRPVSWRIEPLIIWGGFLLDLSQGSGGLNLLALVALVGLINLLNVYISLTGTPALLIFISSALVLNLFLYYFLTLLFQLLNQGLGQYFISLDLMNVFSYLVINLLAVWLIFLLFKNRLTAQSL